MIKNSVRIGALNTAFRGAGIMFNFALFAGETPELVFFVKLLDGWGGLDPVYQSSN